MTISDMYSDEAVDPLIEWANRQNGCAELALSVAKNVLESLEDEEPLSEEDVEIAWQIINDVEESMSSD